MVVGRLWELPCNGYWVLHLDERFLDVCCTTVDIYLARVHCTLKSLSLNVICFLPEWKRKTYISSCFLYMLMTVMKRSQESWVTILHFLDSERHSASYFLTICQTCPQLLKLILWKPWKWSPSTQMPPFAEYLIFSHHRPHCPSSLLQAFTDPWLAVTLSHTTLVLITGNFNISKDGPNSPLSSHFLFIYSSELTFHPLTQSFPRVCVRFLSCAWLFASL